MLQKQQAALKVAPRTYFVKEYSREFLEARCELEHGPAGSRILVDLPESLRGTTNSGRDRWATMMSMDLKRLGHSDLEITRIALAPGPLEGGGWQSGWGPQDNDESIAAIHAALDQASVIYFPLITPSPQVGAHGEPRAHGGEQYNVAFPEFALINGVLRRQWDGCSRSIAEPVDVDYDAIARNA
jgi:hypothetical protein